MKRILWILLPLLIGISSIHLILSLVHPKIESFILGQIQKVSEQNLPFQVNISGFDYHFVLPRVIFRNIEIQGAPFRAKIKEVRANLDIFNLVLGKISLSSLLIESPEVRVELNFDDSTDFKISTQKIFEIIKKVPIYQIGIIDGHLTTKSKTAPQFSSSTQLNAIIYNHKDRLRSQLKSKSSFQYQNYTNENIILELESVLTLNQLELTRFHWRKDQSVMNASGFLSELTNLPQRFRGEFVYQAVINNEQIKWPDFVPPLMGQVTNNGKIEITQSGITRWAGQLETENLSLDNYPIDQVKAEYLFHKNKLKFKKLLLEHSSGFADLSQAELTLNQWTPLSVQVSTPLRVQNLDLRRLLSGLKVGDVPVELNIDGQFECQGEISSDFKITCPGNIHGSDLLVWSQSPRSPIVSVPTIKGTGEVAVNKTSVSYKTKVSVGQSQGESDGIIDFNKGFYINFSTPEISFSDIKSLAGLHLSGSTSLDGFTSGNSHSAIVRSQFTGKNIWLEDYSLGHPAGTLSYESGFLHFSPLQGTIGTSPYQAEVHLDLINNKISLVAESHSFRAEDIIKAFQRKLEIPIEILGTGQFKLSANGPLRFNQLSYDLDAQVRSGSVVGERFDQASVHLISQQGEIEIKKAVLSKNASQINVSGRAHPDGQIQFLVEGNHWQLSESENIAKLGGNIGGIINFDLALTDNILNPNMVLKTQLRQLYIEDQDFPDSLASIKFNKDHLEGQANFFSNRLKCEFKIPYDDNHAFYLKALANQWNFTSIFTLIGGGPFLSEYESQLSGQLELSSPKGGLFSATGKGIINEFYLKRGSLFVKNPKPMELSMLGGLIDLKHFHLTGEGSRLEVNGQGFSKNQLGLQISGKSNLRLLQIFVPFLEDLGGEINLDVSVAGSLFRPEILGKAQLKKAFAKLKGFPHIFERVDSEIDFSQHRISVGQLNGHIAGGTFQGEGKIDIEGIKKYPIKMKFNVEDATLNVPEQIKTTGHAQLALNGEWFPFTLSGDFFVKSGIIDKDFPTDTLMSGPRQSSYLPKIILQSAFEPIDFNIRVHMEKPIQIKNSIGDGLLTGLLDIKGTPNRPIPLGKVNIEKNSHLFFRDQPFNVISGNLLFNNPNELNPIIYVSASTRFNDYDINMLVQGSSRQPQISLSSAPPLPEQEIISLLALGMTTGDLAKSSQQKERENISYQVGTAILSSSPVTKELQKSLGVKIEVSNSFDDTKNVSIPKVKVSRALNKKTQVSASQTLNEQSDVEIKAHYILNKNLSTVLSFERKSGLDSSTSTSTSVQSEKTNIWGLDLEFSREFK